MNTSLKRGDLVSIQIDTAGMFFDIAFTKIDDDVLHSRDVFVVLEIFDAKVKLLTRRGIRYDMDKFFDKLCLFTEKS